MAKISVVGTPFPRVLLNDLTKKQTLREQTLYPEGQERYINPIDVEAVRAQLETLAGGAGTTAEAEATIAGTVGADDISLATIATVAVASCAELAAGEISTAEQRQSVQDLLMFSFVETGQFLLSFDRGVIKGLIEAGWVKVFTDAGDALFTL